MQPVYLIVGCPCAGKSWVCEQLRARFEYVAHDDFIGRPRERIEAIRKAAKIASKPVLTETPFSMSETILPLDDFRIKVIPVVIVETAAILTQRYQQREGRDIPAGHLSRQQTYAQRARARKYFVGTSADVLQFLIGIVSTRTETA